MHLIAALLAWRIRQEEKLTWMISLERRSRQKIEDEEHFDYSPLEAAKKALLEERAKQLKREEEVRFAKVMEMEQHNRMCRMDLERAETAVRQAIRSEDLDARVHLRAQFVVAKRAVQDIEDQKRRLALQQWLETCARQQQYESDKLRIRVLTWNDPSKPAIDVAAAWDRSPNELVWSSNGKVLYATAQNLGQQSLFAIDMASGKVATLIEKGHVGSPARVKTPAADSVAVLIDHLRSPAEVHIVSTEASPGAPVARTTFNKDRVAAPASARPSSSRSRARTAKRCTATS